MKAIFKKELRSYFMSPIAYVFLGVFMFINAFTFVYYQINYSVADVRALFLNTNEISLFLVSILTMRLLSEEKNKKTDQLLLTAPVEVSDIVMGKFFAACTVFLVALLISVVFPVTLFIFGEPSVGECIGGYIGFAMLWASLIAVGVLISALTENQMISAVATFAVLLVLYNLEGIAASVSNQFISGILKSVSLINRYADFSAGVLSLESVVFYLSFIFLILFFAVKVVERRRYS
ncbi:MAG: ABC transporter permease subunit [Clostridia bacterium]|nr:ABC transporter permease subunit [Clostridia bacterium]